MNLLAAGDVTTWAIVAVIVIAIAVWVIKRVFGLLRWLILAAVIGVPGMGALASDLLTPIRATLGI